MHYKYPERITTVGRRVVDDKTGLVVLDDSICPEKGLIWSIYNACVTPQMKRISWGMGWVLPRFSSVSRDETA